MKHTIATILAIFVLLPLASAAINVGTGSPPSDAERADSVQVISFGENAFICVNCEPLTAATEPGLASTTLASYMPRIICKGDTPCAIYTGLKYKEELNPESEYPFIIATKDNYKKDKPLLSSSGQNVRLEDVSRGELIADAENKKVYTIDMIGSEESDPEGLFKNVRKLILQNAKVYINNLPVGTEAPLAGTLSEAEQEMAEDISVTEEEKGQILKIRGLDKRAPNQLIAGFSIPLKKGDTITFKGLFGDRTLGGYRLDMPVMNIGRFTDNEDDSTAEDEDAEDWLDALDNKFLDSSKDRSELKICNQKFVNYYAGSSFAFAGIGVGSGSCKISEYVLNTELFEEDDADDNKLFAYSCGDIVFEAVGGNARNLYCDQRQDGRALLSCGKEGNDEICTGANGKTKIKIRIEPGAFEVDNTQEYMFQSLKEVRDDSGAEEVLEEIERQRTDQYDARLERQFQERVSNFPKAYHFLTGKLKIRTHPQSDNPTRHDTIYGVGENPIIVTYKDNTALGVNTITLPENTVVSRIRGAQLFSYVLKKADYKGVLGEGLHQINLIYPEGLARNEETSTKIKEAKTRGATRSDIALLGAVAEESIEVSSPETHLYSVTPIQPGQEASAAEAQTITPQATAASATTLGAYAYRHCFARDPPAEFRGAQREQTEKIAQAILETNPQLVADSSDVLNTPIPSGASLSLPGTTTEYRLNNNIVRVRVNTQGCFGLSSPAITGEPCMEKPGAVVKCVPTSRQSQCTTVYQEGNGVKGCAENNVCCEVKLSHSAEYCVLPERGAFMADGAKCKVSIGCRTEVSPTDYGKIDVERVNPCAEGLTCCKQARRSAAGTSARTGVRDNNKCTSTGGACADIRNTVCLKEDTSLDLIPFVAGKCLSNRASWYQCCPSGLVQGTSSEFYPDILEDATRNICTTASGTCKASCGTGEIKGTDAQSRECKKISINSGATAKPAETCCVPKQAASATCVSVEGTCATSCEQGEQKSSNEDANKDCREAASNQRMSCCVPAATTAAPAQPSAVPQAATAVSTPEGSMCKSIRGTCRSSCESGETRYSDELQGCAAGSSCCIAIPLCTGFEWSDSLRKQVCTGVRL